MSESEWTFLTNGLGSSDIRRGVSQGFTPPSGGGLFTFGFRSVTTTAGAVGKYVNGANFNPIAAGKGGSVRGALQKGSSDLSTAMLFMSLESNDVNANGYILGYTEDEDPSHLVLAKTSPIAGLQQGAATILRQSAGTYQKNVWHHVRLDVIVQPHGDVHLQVFESDLGSNPVTAPDWQPVDGMAEFIDDALGLNSTSAPLTGGGYAGVAFRSAGGTGRLGLVDQVQVGRQV